MAQDIDEQIIMAEWLCVETLDDVRRRSQEPTKRSRYELLGIAPLLRKLLLDSAPLINTVRRARFRIPVELRIRSWEELDDHFERDGLTRYLGLGGEKLVGGPETSPIRKLDKFNKTVVGIAQDAQLTVRSVIHYYAHVEGGVHFGATKKAGEPTLHRAARMLLGQTTGQIEILAHIGQVVVEALDPLRRSILAEPTVHRLWHVKDERGFYTGHWTTEYLDAYD